MRAFEALTTKWIVTEERAVRCLAEKIERCLTFYDFPEDDWSKIRTNNVAERGLPVRPTASATDGSVHQRGFGGADLRNVRR
jgi:transposase-like protein